MGTQLSNEGTTSDTISRQAAIELCDWYEHEFSECDYAIRALADDLKGLPAAELTQRWIPVTEELPLMEFYDDTGWMTDDLGSGAITFNLEWYRSEPVLITTTDGNVGFGFMTAAVTTDINGELISTLIDVSPEENSDHKIGIEKVIAWMPLPDPYKGEEE